ncbi:MAG: hypothetical protein J6J45_07215 [Clostridia bacterium]|nr:hypothetical protein [Clostridia bacterium]
MKNKLYFISSVILCLSIILCACGKNETKAETTNAAEETATTSIRATGQTTETTTEFQTVTYVDESGYHVISKVIPTTQERTHPPVPSHAQAPTYKTEVNTKAPSKLPVNQEQTAAQNTAKPTQSTAEKTTVNVTELVTVPEKSNGLNVLFKSNSVSRGDDAAITVNGAAGKEYTIEVYRNGKDLLVSDTLKNKQADSNGFVSWTFPTDNCESGYRKIIVRENGSDKYIQTSILVK